MWTAKYQRASIQSILLEEMFIHSEEGTVMEVRPLLCITGVSEGSRNPSDRNGNYKQTGNMSRSTHRVSKPQVFPGNYLF